MMKRRLQAEAQKLVALAKERSLTLATAESCTAGALVHLLADVPGGGEVLHGGFVVYSKIQKTEALGVPEELLARDTAVSSSVATAMAKGALKRSPADLVVAITGVAGPEPDEDGNPVGLVIVAVAARDGRTKVTEYRLGDAPKGEICQVAMRSGIQLLQDFVTAS